jgi:DNA-binding CsgD family transcriptional regulator
MACVGDGLWHGSRDRLDAAIGQADAIVARSGSPAAEVRARVFRWTQMALDGRFEALLAEIPGRNDEDARHLEILYMAWYRPALYLGRTEALQLAVEVAGAAQPALATHLLTFTGGDDLARERVRSAVRAGRAWSPGHVLLLEAANRLGEREAAAMRLEQADRAGAVTTGFECATIIDRHRGDALALLGHVEDAREAYASAIGVAERMRWRPEIALIRLSQARLLLEHEPTSRPDALAHLEFAAKEFEAMGMLPYLQDAASLAEQLRGTTRHPAGLSEREVEVLRLLAEGRSNAGIAAELVIAQATVARHASNILNKTGLSNRTQAAAFAVAHGLAIAGPAEQRP